MLRLSEWNEVIKYAKDIARSGLYMKDGRQIFIDIRSTIYTMYDGRKGIYLITYDTEGKPHQRYASGIHESYEGYVEAIDRQLQRIIAEY